MSAFRKFVSMELDDEDKLDAVMPIAMPDKPDFPYELRIAFSERTLAKLGLNGEEAEVGDSVEFFASARVTSKSSSDTESGKCCRVELQIEQIELDDDD